MNGRSFGRRRPAAPCPPYAVPPPTVGATDHARATGWWPAWRRCWCAAPRPHAAGGRPDRRPMRPVVPPPSAGARPEQRVGGACPPPRPGAALCGRPHRGRLCSASPRRASARSRRSAADGSRPPAVWPATEPSASVSGRHAPSGRARVHSAPLMRPWPQAPFGAGLLGRCPCVKGDRAAAHPRAGSAAHAVPAHQHVRRIG